MGYGLSSPYPMYRRRKVHISNRIPSRKGGAQPVLWAYGYADIAALVGKSEHAVRQDACREKFSPADLASVVAYVTRLSTARNRTHAQ